MRKLIAVLLLVLLCGFLWPSVHLHLKALAVLKAASGQAAPRWLRLLATERSTQQELTLQTDAGPVRARLYTPARHPNAAGLVIFHGVHHLGIDEPRLKAFAEAIAASGVKVLTPELPDIKDYRVSERSIHVIGASAKWFATKERAPVGVMGLSFAGGLALVSAADVQYQPSIRFVLAVGSQGAMSRVADYYRTGADPRPDGTTEILPAHEYGPLVLEYEHIEEFVPVADAAAIRAVLRAHLYEDKAAEDEAAQRLSPKQALEAKRMLDAASDATRNLLQTSAARHRDDMQALSPEAHLHDLTTPVFLLHGEGDNIIPAAETLWMASQLRAETLQAALVSPVLSHLDMNKQPGLWDESKLVHFMAQVLRAAQAA